jgi:hypothetical protein
MYRGLVLCDEEVFAVSNEVATSYRETVELAERVLLAKGAPMNGKEVASTVRQLMEKEIDLGMIERCCEVSSRVCSGADETIGLRRWSFFTQNRLHNIAQRALLQIGRPSHYTQIAGRMNLMVPARAPFSPVSVLSRLQLKRDIFISLGRGSYALANWGIKRAPMMKDFVADEMLRLGRPVSAVEIIDLGREKYGYKESSIKMTLSMDGRRFRRLGDGRYWLANISLPGAESDKEG